LISPLHAFPLGKRRYEIPAGVRSSRARVQLQGQKGLIPLAGTEENAIRHDGCNVQAARSG
jgi:hypothetical protein